MVDNILNSKLDILKLDSKLDKLKNLIAMSKFSGKVRLVGFSKFSSGNKIKSELDMKIPMEVELLILKEGDTKDGKIVRVDLEESLEMWAGLPIIDFHNMKDMKHPTDYRITDKKGLLGANPQLKIIDSEEWIINSALITDRYLAYLIYLQEQQGKPLEVSAEFQRTQVFNGLDTHLVNIRPHIISIVDNGEMEGSKIKIKNPV